jgi:hypothetical protein
MRNPVPKQIFAADASSLILLYKTDLIETMAQYCEFWISTSIWNELTHNRPTTEIAVYKSTTVINLLEKKRQQSVAHLSAADMTVLQLYFSGECSAIFSDDGVILRLCKKLAIPHYCALSILPCFLSYGFFKKGFVESKMAQVERLGRYSKKVIQTAEQMFNEAV